MVDHEKALHNYFIPCQRKYIILHNKYRAIGEGFGGIPINIPQLSRILIGCISSDLV